MAWGASSKRKIYLLGPEVRTHLNKESFLFDVPMSMVVNYVKNTFVLKFVWEEGGQQLTPAWCSNARSRSCSINLPGF